MNKKQAGAGIAPLGIFRGSPGYQVVLLATSDHRQTAPPPGKK